MRHSSLKMHPRAGRAMLIVVLFAAASPLCMMNASSLPDTSVRVEPRENSAIVGEGFSVNLTIVDVQNLYGLEAILSWDSTVLALANVETRLGQEGGVLNNPIYVAENSTMSSKYTIAATSTSPAYSFNGTGEIVRLSFDVIGAGACEIDLQTQLYDYPPPDRDPRFSLPIAHIDADGLFQGAIPEFPCHLIPMAAAVLTLFSLALFKHISSGREKTFDSSVQAGVVS